MHLRGNVIYNTWENFWKKAYKSSYFRAQYDETSERTDWSLSERQLFTQSNGRTLLGQDTMGRLHFLCTPHDKIYAVPSGGTDLGGQFKGYIGQYYQNDTALLLGKMKYDLELDNGLMISGANKQSWTTYYDDFLPVTATEHPELETRIFSFAPILEKEAVPASSIHPVPGPAGAFYCIEVKNTSGCKIKGKLRLSFDQKFVNQFEHYGKYFDDYTVTPYKSEWDQKLLVLWHPEACAAIQLLDSVCEGQGDNPRIYVPFELKANESRTFTTVIALTPKREEIYSALGTLYQHTPLEWLNVTDDFWKERFGKITTDIRENQEAGEKYRDMQVRFILDNFNCLSFREDGSLLTNWQGAPSHSLSRLWGIDITPDVVSVMYAVPEVGKSAMFYLAERNRPRYSLYSDHSMFYYISLLVIAGKYLELTGDEKFFRDHPELVAAIDEIYDGMMKHKHKEKALISSRYASDLIVFRKYDYGANVQCYYALKSYRRILKLLERDATDVDRFMEQMKADMKELMEGSGPFGRQITGGNNLGENEERFYIQDDLNYYGGEDTATVMAPLYGLYEFDYEPYVNLHRYARSMYITNYDPEFQTMRELHFGMNPSATGCTLKLGGSLTRQEMLDNLNLLYERLDETGSLFWWPRATNKKRCLTRCSQGQGAWIQQSVEQWFGLRMDGTQKTLVIKPQGLLSGYKLQKTHLGAYVFDIEYREEKGKTVINIKNYNEEAIKVVFEVRKYGAGAQGECIRAEELVLAGAFVEKEFATETMAVQETDIAGAECSTMTVDGILFSPYGIIMPKLYNSDCGIFLFRYLISQSTDTEWKNAEVKIEVPDGWKVQYKQFYHWDYQPVFSDNKAVCMVGEVPQNTHKVAGFYISLPDELAGGEKSVMLSEHPFPQDTQHKMKQVTLYVEGQKTQAAGVISASLETDGKQCKVSEIPVLILSKEDYADALDKMYHGTKK